MLLSLENYKYIKENDIKIETEEKYIKSFHTL